MCVGEGLKTNFHSYFTFLFKCFPRVIGGVRFRLGEKAGEVKNWQEEDGHMFAARPLTFAVCYALLIFESKL